MNEYICPDCGAVISMEDVNVATDLALCRSCGKTYKFSELVDDAEIENINLTEKPKYVTVECNRENSSSGISIRYRKFNPLFFFVFPFTCVWGGVSLSTIYGKMILQNKFNIVEALFGIPFLIGTVVLTTICLLMLFGYREIVLKQGRGSSFFGFFGIGLRRKFEYNRTSKIAVVESKIYQNNQVMYQLSITTNGKSMKFGTNLPYETLTYIAKTMMNHIRGY